MKSSLYVIVDASTKTCTAPFVSPNDDIAKRNTVFGAIEAMTPVQDLTLYKIGDFEYHSEDFVGYEQIKLSATPTPIVVNISSEETYRLRDQFKELRGEDYEE